MGFVERFEYGCVFIVNFYLWFYILEIRNKFFVLYLKFNNNLVVIVDINFIWIDFCCWLVFCIFYFVRYLIGVYLGGYLIIIVFNDIFL